MPNTPPLFIPTNTPTRSPELYVAEAENYVSQGKYNQAIQVYQQVIRVDPHTPSYYLALARLYIYSGDYPDAITYASDVLLLNPNNDQAYMLRAWAQALNGDYTDADASITEAQKLNSTSPQIYAIQALVLAEENQAGSGALDTLQKAIDASHTAVNMAPDALETHWARGLVLEITSNYTDAVTEYQAAIAINDNIAELHMSLGNVYRALQENDQAISEYARANALTPADPDPDLYMSRAYANAGEWAKAIQFAQQAVQEAPGDASMLGNLAWDYYHNLDYQNAVMTFDLAIHGGTTSDGVNVAGLKLDYGRSAEYYYTYGLALSHLGYCGQALQIAQALQQGVSTDQTSQDNATEIISECTAFAKSGSPTPTALSTPTSTPTPEGTATPILPPTLTPTP
ncbi:MAG TPA: tetratricopeptide repeat protein [Longilinea sp.]|nr:tetratricopeptide repeat protein [Longilinea sp.]